MWREIFLFVAIYLLILTCHFMPLEIHKISEPYRHIIEELLKLKDLYPYSNNNDAYNAAIDMCIKCVELVEKESKNNTNDKKTN